MKKNVKPILVAFCLGVSMINAHATPASTDFVNNRIRDEIAGLEQQMTARIREARSGLESQMNTSIHDSRTELEQQMTININETRAGLEQQINDGVAITYHLGEIHEGGIIFWLDPTNQHGLIAAKIDANEGLGMQWQNGESGDRITNAHANGIRGGVSNTQIIIAQQTADDQQGDFAALSASSFSVDASGESQCSEQSEACFSDWYLPSIFELKLMKNNLYSQGVGNIAGEYWSSNEQNVSHAMSFSVELGEVRTTDKAIDSPKIRPIRVF